MKKQEFTQVRNIVGIFLGSILFAILLSVYMIYYYSPSGQFLAANTILAPEIIKEISYNDNSGAKGVRFIFNDIEFFYYDKDNHRFLKKNINLEDYLKFYKSISAEKSIEPVSSDIESLFTKNPKAYLAITMKADAPFGKDGPRVFQTIQFIDDYFRVQLIGKTGDEWAYFSKKGVYNEILELFTRSL